MLVSFVLLGLLLVIYKTSDNGLAGLQATTIDSKMKMDIKTMFKTLVSKNEKKIRAKLSYFQSAFKYRIEKFRYINKFSCICLLNQLYNEY